MTPSPQSRLFLESIYDALSALVQAAGGTKIVGHAIWPSKSPEAAGKTLADCLNPLRADTLNPEEFMQLLRIGRDAGFHEAKRWIDAEAGYTLSDPVDPESQASARAQAVADAARELRRATDALERFQRGTKR